MKITPLRSMRLGGVRVEFGTPAEVPDDEAQLAVRHGWAVLTDEPAAQSVKKPTRPTAKAAAQVKAGE